MQYEFSRITFRYLFLCLYDEDISRLELRNWRFFCSWRTLREDNKVVFVGLFASEFHILFVQLSKVYSWILSVAHFASKKVISPPARWLQTQTSEKLQDRGSANKHTLRASVPTTEKCHKSNAKGSLPPLTKT